MERSLIIIKPDAVNRALIGSIIERFERKGLKIIAMKMQTLTLEVLKEHYKHHKDKPFFSELINFMSSAPAVLFVVEGKDAIMVARKICGVTNGREAEPGTIRGDYSMSNQNNLVHASDSIETAEVEIKRFFSEEELCEYSRTDIKWIYSNKENKT